MTLSKAAKAIEDEFAEYEARRMARQAPSWRPTVGDRFKGEVIGLRMGGSEPPVGYGIYPIIVYRDLADGSIKAVHAFHSVLRQSLADLKTDIGTVQFISYQGEQITNATKDKDPKEQIRYQLYDVENVGDEVAETPAKEAGFAF